MSSMQDGFRALGRARTWLFLGPVLLVVVYELWLYHQLALPGWCAPRPGGSRGELVIELACSPYLLTEGVKGAGLFLAVWGPLIALVLAVRILGRRYPANSDTN